MRAFRHPERYGPRAYDPTIEGPGGYAQTRALGIARAVLDTFPVIKWGGGNNPHDLPTRRGYPEPKTWAMPDENGSFAQDVENQGEQRRLSAGSRRRRSRPFTLLVWRRGPLRRVVPLVVPRLRDVHGFRRVITLLRVADTMLMCGR